MSKKYLVLFCSGSDLLAKLKKTKTNIGTVRVITI